MIDFLANNFLSLWTHRALKTTSIQDEMKSSAENWFVFNGHSDKNNVWITVKLYDVESFSIITEITFQLMQFRLKRLFLGSFSTALIYIRAVINMNLLFGLAPIAVCT